VDLGRVGPSKARFLFLSKKIENLAPRDGLSTVDGRRSTSFWKGIGGEGFRTAVWTAGGAAGWVGEGEEGLGVACLCVGVCRCV